MISGVYAIVTADTSLSVGLPSCRSAAAIAEVKNILANLPKGDTSGIGVVDLRDQQTVAQSAEKVSCSARALLKDGRTVPVQYEFDREDGKNLEQAMLDPTPPLWD
jgi:hypothetical protein